MRIQYTPETGLILRFEGDEIEMGVEIAEGVCDMYDDNGIDTKEVRMILYAIQNVKLTRH